MRINSLAKNDAPERISQALREEHPADRRITAASPDSIPVKVHPDAGGALKKMGYRRWGNPVKD
jgi:hypothetical protein